MANLGRTLIDYGMQAEGPASLRTLPTESSDFFEVLSNKCQPRLRSGFRRLLVRLERTRQEWNRLGRPLSSITIASPRPGTGRSFLARNLAAELALVDCARVLLVEADFVNPRFEKTFGTGTSPGFRDSLANLDWRPSLLRISESGLFVLPAGSGQTALTWFAEQGRLSRFVEQASRRFDWIVFDGPALDHPDAEILAKHTDGSIVVLETDPGSLEAARAAVSKIEGERLVGMVLNRT